MIYIDNTITKYNYHTNYNILCLMCLISRINTISWCLNIYINLFVLGVDFVCCVRLICVHILRRLIMNKRPKALELLTYIESHDQEVRDLIYNLSFSNHGILCAKNKLMMEMQTGVSLDSAGVDHFRVCYSPTDVYLTKYEPTEGRTLLNVKIKEPEWLLHFWFSTGAYSLHQDYPQGTYHRMIEELKEVLKPKYIDKLNLHFYLEPEKAVLLKEQLPLIFNKYKAEVQEELDKKRIATLEAELLKLKGE